MKKGATGIKPIDEYCKKVKSGKIPACKWVKFAVDRHFENLKNQNTKSFPYFFDPGAANHFFDFCKNHLAHYEGLVNGEPLLLEPWQQFIYGSIFGWMKTAKFRGKHIRRFRTANIIIPKKNGKSILSGAVGLYMSSVDGWPAAQCYILAKNQTHAKDLGYRAACIMSENSPTLSQIFKENKGAGSIGLYCKSNNSFYKPITSKPDSEDGRNVHFCGPDETKDWTDFEIYELMKNGTVNAPNSLFMSTTTAGPNRNSLGFVQQGYVEQVLSGAVKDDTTFGIIYGIDEEDRRDKEGNIKENYFLDKKLWKKANPNYEVSVFEDSLQSLCNYAKQSSGKRIAFETKHLNIWHSSNESFIMEEKWISCGRKISKPLFHNMEKFLEKVKGRTAYGGLDMGLVSDFCSFELVLPPAIEQDPADPYEVYSFFWIPKDNIQDRKNKELVAEFVRQGHVFATPGDYTDHDFIEAMILKIAEYVRLEEIAYDRFKMDQMVTHLDLEGLEMTPFGQGFVSMSPAVDTLENMVLKKKIEHFNNPVLSWMNRNVSIRKDPAGNRKFDKDKSEDKIDGMVALAMALHRASVLEDTAYSDWSEVKVF